MNTPQGRRRFIISSTLFASLLLGNSAIADEATPVRTQPLGELLQAQQYSAPATVVARDVSEISAEISARIEQLVGQPGDVVRAGALLVRLDCRDASRRLTAARASERALDARRELAAQQLARAKRLVKARSGTEELVDQRRAELRAAEAELDAQRANAGQAQLAIERCEIRAPFDAAVTARLAGTGGYASPGKSLLRLTSLAAPEVSAQIPVDLAAELTAAKVQFAANEKQITLTLRQLSPLADPRARSREARFIAADSLLPGPGHSGRVHWSGSARLPANLLSRRGEQLGLLLADGEVARFHPLPEAAEGQPTRLELPADTLLITDGRHGLADGDPIRHTD